MVFFPVSAHIVLVTDESIPPDIPIIKESDQLPEYDVAVITELSNIDQTIEDAYKAIDDRNKILIPKILGFKR